MRIREKIRARKLPVKYLLPGFLAVLSISAWAVTLSRGLVTSYNDAMSHLNIARLVVDNIQPGISQLGTVWLPLSHILYLPLIWNDWAWHSGFAGSIISMASFVAAGVGIFLIVLELTGSKLAAYISAAALALNLNLLYLQATPLTEPLYIALFIYTAYFLLRYFKEGQNKFLTMSAVFTALQIMTRYDGWFVAVICAAAIAIFEMQPGPHGFRKATGPLTLFGFPVGFTMLLWLGWNKLIFGKALYFITGPYSAYTQAQGNSSLITKHHLAASIHAFGLDMGATIGWLVLAAATLGWTWYLIHHQAALNRRGQLLILGVLASTIAFNILSLFFGFSVINLPALHWHPDANPASVLFNVRYGLVALPAAAIGIGLLAKKKLGAVIVATMLVIQGLITYHGGIITVQDGTIGQGAFTNQDVANYLKNNVLPDDKVLISTFTFSPVMFQSGLPLRQYIHEGASKEWQPALDNPELHAKWLVMSRTANEPVYRTLVTDHDSAFAENYVLAFHGAHADIFERKQDNEAMVTTNGQNFEIQGQKFAPIGANQYDLAYRSPAEIDRSLSDLKAAGATTVRFWVFGDGTPDGFQPQPGSINEQRLEGVDAVIASAEKYGLHLIPVLANSWTDYGGVGQYLQWAGLSTDEPDAFYTSYATQSLYKNYVSRIITRRNSITQRPYTDEPTILSWELVNEPRASQLEPITSWTTTMSQYIKQLDPNHLVSIGIDKDTLDKGGVSLCEIPSIGFCSIHLYPSSDKQPLYPSLSRLNSDLTTYRKNTSKPLIVSEFGVEKTENTFGKKPLDLLQTFVRQFRSDGYQGWLVWNWTQDGDNAYGFSKTGTQNTYNLTDLSRTLNAR